MASCSEAIVDNVVINPERNMSASDFISDCRIMTLSKSDGNLISEVKSIRKNDSIVALLCKDVVYMFDAEGNLANKIDRKGKGKGEYILIDDFQLTDSKLYILSRMQKKLLEYDMRGNFIEGYNLNEPYCNFRLTDDNNVIFASVNNNDSHYNFVTYNLRSRKIIAKTARFERNEACTFTDFNAFIGQKNDFYVANPFDYAVYRISNDTVVEVQRFDFQTQEQLPDNKEKLSFWELNEKSSNRNVVKYLLAYTEVGDYRYVVYPLFGERGIQTCITRIDRSGNNKTMKIASKTEKVGNYLFAGQYLGICDNEIVNVGYPDVLLEKEKEFGLSELAKRGVTSESNPVLLFYKLKGK